MTNTLLVKWDETHFETLSISENEIVLIKLSIERRNDNFTKWKLFSTYDTVTIAIEDTLSLSKSYATRFNHLNQSTFTLSINSIGFEFVYVHENTNEMQKKTLTDFSNQMKLLSNCWVCSLLCSWIVQFVVCSISFSFFFPLQYQDYLLCNYNGLIVIDLQSLINCDLCVYFS